MQGYGDTPEQIAEAIIAEWLASGAGDPDFSALWFATPKLYTTPQKWALEPPPATLDEARHIGHGWTVAEWQKQRVDQLALNPFGLWLIVSDGREWFRLSGENLIAFVRQGILALLRAGARLLERVAGPPPGWNIAERYGETPEQIAEAVTTEWIAAGCGDPDDRAVWFGRPSIDAPRPPVP